MFGFSQLYILFGTQKYHLDDSIMPWYNNKTLLLSKWFGEASANPYTDT